MQIKSKTVMTWSSWKKREHILLCLLCPNWIFLRSVFYLNEPSWHGCISQASLRLVIQCLRDISKRAVLQIFETSPGRLIRDVSSETSLRYLRFSQRRLWVASEIVILGLQTKGSFWLPAHQPIILLIILPN